MSGPLDALRSSIDRLAALVAPLDDEAIVRPAYPVEWTIADVLAHLGSGSELYSRRVAEAVTSTPSSDESNEQIVAAWDAKSPRQTVDDAIAANDAFSTLLVDVTPAEQDRFSLDLGPTHVGWEELLGIRLDEHLLHEWDVAVALEPGAVLAPDGVPLVLDRIIWTCRLAAHPAGPTRTITIATSEPEQSFAIEVDHAEVKVTAGVPIPPVDIQMEAESFVRLVYGRLDPDHTPSEVIGADNLLHQLRAVFPGV